MWTDVLDLNEFYSSTLGQMTVRLLRARLREVWPNVRGETVLGLGYATPFLRPFMRGGRAHPGLHAGAAGRDALAARGPQPHRPGRRDRPAAARPLGRPRAAGPCHRMHRAGAADAARDLAGDGRWRHAWSPWRRRAPACGRRSTARRSTRAIPTPPASSPASCAPTCSRRCARRRALFMPPTHSRLMLRMAPARRALRPALARPLRRRQRHRGRQAALCRRRRAPYLARARRRAAQAAHRQLARHAGRADTQRGRRSTGLLISTPHREHSHVAVSARDRAAGLW